ncbi:hypothetical protein Tco_1457886 [Tanacetum coccineum]
MHRLASASNPKRTPDTGTPVAKKREIYLKSSLAVNLSTSMVRKEQLTSSAGLKVYDRCFLVASGAPRTDRVTCATGSFNVDAYGLVKMEDEFYNLVCGRKVLRLTFRRVSSFDVSYSHTWYPNAEKLREVSLVDDPEVLKEMLASKPQNWRKP